MLTEAPYDKDSFYTPAILENVTPDMEIFREEVFGPVLSVTRYKTLEEAVELAYATPFALGASIFTENIRRATYPPEQASNSVVVIVPIAARPTLIPERTASQRLMPDRFSTTS